ncbi:PAS domain-containing sensor histidine kinase [Maribacter hydrothermalis]|uniref:histidine kinase n=1 Tax=Maribacter hydrothermalis TaxID=1836467 RepID=A0A1B7Z1W3_9FLAO|nr:PAS domain-containing sensor histidine kinase [Maribacter hydrothermalis]APQ18359.1 PAS domain-containing sensor histidine kinase [Maribacter hydrothermalis]OBR36705.1 PAS domain-containing sensor histidine kinase [Maribacter hydrothermalis]
MDNTEVILLKKALLRQKEARKQAERILEEKSKELYDVSSHLKDINSKLENLLSEKTSELDGIFINIIDPYVVMDMSFNVINMNTSAKEFLGFDHTKNLINLSEFIHPEFLAYTQESMQSLLQVGTLSNYRAKILTKNAGEKWVQISASLVYDKNRNPIAAQGIIRDITQETEVKSLLVEQKKQLDLIVENSPLGIVLSVNGEIIKANNAFVEMLGYTEFELRKRSLKELSEPEDPTIGKSLLEQMNAGEIDSFKAVKKFTKKDNSKILAKTMVTAITKNKGKSDYQVAIIEDISRQLESERKLKASENRLSALISNLQTGVLLEDEDGKIALTNQMFCNIFNINETPKDLIGTDCRGYAEISKNVFKNSKNFMSRIEEILEKKETILADELEMTDGKVLARDFIPIDNEGDYKGHLWAYNDITISKKYRKNLEAQREKYGSIIANMNLGLVEVDNEDVIQMVNQSFCKMSGFEMDELIGKVASKLIKINDDCIITTKNQDRREGKSESYEVEVIDKSQNKKHWLISGAPRYDDTGRVIGSIGIHLDITEHKELELQKEKLLLDLENSNQGLQEYAHIVSHDLKSPLRSISALATWLFEDYKDVLDEGGRQNLELMQEKVASMDKLIQGILEYSTANNSALSDSKIDLNTIISDIRETIYIPEHVDLVVPKQLPSIMADRTKLYQVFQNIIGNAVVHIERDVGIVEVLFKDLGEYWQFTISDNGVGIPEEYHKKIFEIFQSIGNNERSTGIGLSIVKKIVDRYHGDVWVDSVVGEGTQFHFTIKKILTS